MKNICVYCSANKKIHENYLRDAETIGEMIALKGYNLVYGGSDLGTMGIVSSTAKKYGAKVYGVMPEKIYNFIEHEGSFCDEFILTDNMRDRKEKMYRNRQLKQLQHLTFHPFFLFCRAYYLSR